MDAAQDSWWIIGSAAVALHGVHPLVVGDVDVLMSVADARRLLPDLGLAIAAGPHGDRFRSDIFGRRDGPPLAVEFMAGLHVHRPTGWIAVNP